MSSRRRFSDRKWLLLSTVLGVGTASGVAQAQTVEAQSRGDVLQEIVVTATRQTETANRVPLSITAQTQRTLDERGIRTVQDLQSTVPALVVTQSLGTGVANVAIRGIVQGTEGASTTGFYLDDTPLQKRNVGGGPATSNGTPLPPLFDLERIEVLRGPQGTLFGGGSEGGTIRYITPQPSLTRYSALVRAGVSDFYKGGASYEGGVAVGGPIVQDKLGFRASFYDRKRGGFIDNINPYTGAKVFKDSNEGDIRVFRGALTWAPTERSKITLSYLKSRDHSDNNTNSFNLSTTNPIVVPTTCYNTNGIQNLTVGAVTRVNPVPVGRGDAQCAQLRASGGATYTQPGGSLGPYNLDKYEALLEVRAPSTTNLQVASLTLDYDLGNITFKSVTSYIEDETKTLTLDTSQYSQTAYGATYGSIAVPSGIYLPPGYPTIRSENGLFYGKNARYGLTQEFRFASRGDARPLTWVAGVYYSNMRGRHRYDNYYNMDKVAGLLYGITEEQRYGVGSRIPGDPNNFGSRFQQLNDVEVAAFGEANYWVTGRLRLTGGVRYSRTSFDYNQAFWGPFAGFGVPTFANGGLTQGSVTESPITPKFGAQYQISDNDMVYVTAAKGFRAGGINGRVTRAICARALDQFGIDLVDLPEVYKSDSVWSYEAGAKLRLFNRLQLNGAAYQIDWTDPQVTLTPGVGCGIPNTYNAASARSRGFEVEAQARLWAGFSASILGGYNKTEYTQRSVGVVGRNGVDLVIAQKGQKFALPPYTISASLRYDTEIGGYRVFARGEWTYAADYETFPFGIPGWNPDANIFPAIQKTNVRVGVERGGVSVDLFVNNLFNEEKGNVTGGRSGCALPPAGTQACNTFTVYNPLRTTNWGLPREIGVQINYRR